MAIRLASAIGQQREPIGILGGLDEAINRTGDAIQAASKEKRDAAAKKRDQEQRLKDAYAANFKVEPLEKAVPEENKEYEDYAKAKGAEIFVASQDPNISASQLKKMQDEALYGLEERRIKYAQTYDTLNDVAGKLKTHDTSLFDNFMIGRTSPTQVAEMPNDDFMAASEADRAGKMVGEDGMKATETKTTYQGVPYLNLPFEEKKKINFRGKADELIALKQPEITKAAQGYFGKDFKFDSYTKRTDKVSPTTGEYIFEFDEGQADLDAKKFASSMVGEGSFGDANHAQMQRALEYEALRAGNEAGFSGDKLAAFVEETVPKMAYDKFMADAKAAEAARMKNQKDITKQPSKGGDFNVNIGGGGENKLWKFGTPKTVQIREGAMRDATTKELSKTNKGNLVDYEYISMQTKTPASNPPMIVDEESGNVYYQGVVKKKGDDDFSYFKFTKKSDGTGDDILVPKNKLNASTYADIRTNVGEDDFEKAAAIGRYAPKKEDKKALTKAAAPKKSEYKLSELTVDFINGLGEGEVVVVDGVKRVKQDGKLKKVKK